MSGVFGGLLQRCIQVLQLLTCMANHEWQGAHSCCCKPQARQKGTGARGLRSILENVLLEAQYHVRFWLLHTSELLGIMPTSVTGHLHNQSKVFPELDHMLKSSPSHDRHQRRTSRQRLSIRLPSITAMCAYLRWVLYTSQSCMSYRYQAAISFT